MRRITLMLVSTLAAIVILFSYRTSTRGSTAVTASDAQPPGIVTAGTPTPALSKSKSAKSAKPVQSAASVTVNGTVSQTRYGPVQVQVTISGKKIVSVKALQHPSGNGQSDQINARALPQLSAEVLSAQSARINTVSGATYTSNGYTSSLQAALDAAHFA